jgi:hypothetical protein
VFVVVVDTEQYELNAHCEEFGVVDVIVPSVVHVSVLVLLHAHVGAGVVGSINVVKLEAQELYTLQAFVILYVLTLE